MPKTALDAPQVISMLQEVCQAIIAAEPLLTDADRALGDGDHGLGMQRGMTAALEKLGALDPESTGIDKAFSTLGMAMMSTMGGASGALFGTLFRNGGKAIAGNSHFGTAELAELLKVGLEGVMSRGGAKPGDKTMINALHPAAEKALEEAAAGSPFAEAINAVAAAGEAGRDASENLIATMGRAKTLGEKSLGKPDAGACSVAIILRTMAEFSAK